MTGWRDLSFWHDSLPADDDPPRAPLPGSRTADVAIVGAGYTGLWTAYALLRADPTLQVVVLEKERAGYGASGRNGGWCSALFPASWPTVARRSSRDAAIRLQRAMIDTVDHVGKTLVEEGIEAHWAKGGTIALARTDLQWERAEAAVADARRWGLDESDVRLLDAATAAAMAGGTHVRGGVYSPHCAAVHPARLVRGLARAVEARGAVLFEQTPVLAIEPGVVRTAAGDVHAPFVVRATEAYTAGLPGSRRDLIPFPSTIVLTEPLPATAWDRIGLADRPTFADLRHMVVYGQRTADDRLLFGGRGVAYGYGSSMRPKPAPLAATYDWLQRELADLFPEVRQAAITHRWTGMVGIARDWWASCGFDRRTGLAWAGGYVGDGVGTANLAGRTLADLILGRDTELVDLPWVGHRSRRWEPEPLRWLGVNAGFTAATLADAEERRTGRPSLLAAATARLLG